MKEELNRVKDDFEIIKKALGLDPSFSREWINWMKQDCWFGLWWCIPGLILVATGFLPLEDGAKYLGLVRDQWMGILVAVSMLLIVVVQSRKVKEVEGRPHGFVREWRRINGTNSQSLSFFVVLVSELLVYVIWGKLYGIGFEPLWSGLFILMGSSCLVGAVAAKVWPLLGWAIPFLAYGMALPLVRGMGNSHGILLGLMFIAVALSFSLIAVIQIRNIENYDTD